MSFRRDHIAALPDKRMAFALDLVMKSLEPTGDDTAITAKAGGGQSSATPLKSDIFAHEVTTVASAADSVSLPPAVPGAMHFVKNSAANAMQVYGAGTDTIDSVATATGISQGAGEGELYYCVLAGNYIRLRGIGASETFTNLTLTGLLFESTAGGLTAGATQTQAGALALTKEMNRVTTVATAGDGVALPQAQAGLTIIVINKGANSMQVYPINAGTDAIDGQSANSSVNQMANSMVIYSCTTAGAWDSEGLGTGYSGSFQTQSFSNAITAFATGGQASAVALTSMMNRITICATAGDSVKLPASAPGMSIIVSNDGATAADVFPATGDAINGQAANIAVRLKPGAVVVFFTKVAGTWNAQFPNLKFLSLAASGAVAAQAETIFGTNQYTILANSLKPGQRIKVRGQGTVTTANGTLQVRMRYGGVAGVLMLDTGASITPSNGDLFHFDGEFVVTDVGATGHVYGTFMWGIGTSATGTTRFGKTASIAIDTTADKVLNVTQQNGTGAGSVTLDYLSVVVE